MAIVTDGATRDGGGGGSSFPATTNLSMGGNKLTSVGTPTANGDAATKKYVDDSVPAMDHAIVKATSSQALTGGAFTKIEFGTVVVDSGDLTDTANQFTIATTGTYSVTFFVGVSSGTTSRLQAAISVNGAAFSNSGSVQTITSSKVSRSVNEYWAVSCAGIVQLTAADTVFAYLYSSDAENTSNASCADVPYAYFSIARVG